LLLQNTFAGVVTLQDATTVASNFYNSNFGQQQRTKASGTLVYTRSETNGTVDFYVFDFAPAKGFVIVSANDALSPVIGYSGESNFNTGFSTKGLGEWMDHAALHISTAVQNNAQADKHISSQWNNYKNGVKSGFGQKQPGRSAFKYCLGTGRLLQSICTI